MRARLCGLLCAALGGATAYSGCRAVEGLDGLPFDTSARAPDGSEGAGGATLDASISGGGGCFSPPAGWSGPIAIYEGSPRTTPVCPSGYPYLAARGSTGLDLPTPQCSACTCAPAVTCTPGSLEVYSKPTCKGAKATTAPLSDGSCTIVSGDSFVAAAPQVNVGDCAPDGGVVAPLTWASEGVACAPSNQGICPPVPAPFAAERCVFELATDARPCPQGFPHQHVWETANDTRACTPCTCGDPAQVTCTVTARSYSDAACQSFLSSSDMVGVCVPQPGMVSMNVVTTLSESPGCPASVVTATGSVVTTPVVTICCPS